MHIKTKYKFWVCRKMFGNRNKISDGEINPRRENTISENFLGNYRSKNDLSKPPNPESLLLSHCAIEKWISQHGQMRKTTENVREKRPSCSSCMRKRNTWVNNGLGTHFLEFYCPISKNTFLKNDGLPQYEIDCHTLLFPSH